MVELEIRKAENGWVVFPAGQQPGGMTNPYVFNDWDELVAYLKKELALSGPAEAKRRGGRR